MRKAKIESSEKTPLRLPELSPYSLKPNSGYFRHKLESALSLNSNPQIADTPSRLRDKVEAIRQFNSSTQTDLSVSDQSVQVEKKSADDLFKRIVDGQPKTAIVAIDAKTNEIVFVSSYAEELFGITRDVIAKKGISALMPEQEGQNTEAVHRMYVNRFFHNLLKHGSQFYSKILNTERYLVGKRMLPNGEMKKFTLALHVTGHAIADASPDATPEIFVGFMRDADLELQIKADLASYKFITQHSTEGIVICDMQGGILSVNPAFQKLVGFDSSALLGNNVAMLMPTAIGKKHPIYLRRFNDNLYKLGYSLENSSTIGREREVAVRRYDGTESRMMSRIELNQNDRKNPFLVGFFRDRDHGVSKIELTERVYKKILPDIVADDLIAALRAGQKNQTKYYDDLAVILVDLEGFTRASALHDAKVVNIDIDDMIYQAAKVVGSKYRVHIVKSTGDGFIAVVGLHKFDLANTRSDRAVCFGYEMSAWAKENGLKMRVGIARGQVGSKVLNLDDDRVQWDVSGLTVCVASRMESNSQPHQVRLDPVAFEALSDEAKPLFHLETKHPKNLDQMETHYIDQRNDVSAKMKSFSHQVVTEMTAHIETEVNNQNQLTMKMGKR